MKDFIEKEISIKEIYTLLNDGKDIEIFSPDGYVPVSKFVDKGIWDEYVMITNSGILVRVNEDHLFEMNTGWEFAKNLVNIDGLVVLTENGYERCVVIKTGNTIPIVDIKVEHDNHRYYANGISSHNTGTGKTNIKCHCATAHIKMGKNVLYITNEMSEEKIGERVDANMLNVELDKLEAMGREAFTTRLQKLSSKTNGKLIIKEYPMHSAHSGHFKALIEELRIKKNFIPDVVYIDYLGICASARYKSSTGINTNTYYGSVAEELRALGQFYNIPVVSSIQTNRSGSTNSDLGLTDIADSFSIAMAADLVIGLVTNEELAALNQMLFVVLKNRHNDVNYYKKFLLGVDRAKMRLYNLDDSVSKVPDIQPIASQVKQSDKKRDFSGFEI